MDNTSLEIKSLNKAIEEEATIRLIFTNGYQTDAVILDYDFDVIIARVNGKRQLIYRNALSTIVLD